MLLSRNKNRTLFRRIALFIMLSIGATGAASLAVVQVWDGGFHQAEFRLRFVDAEDRPVSGVTLLVTDALGQRANCYPVSDFHEGAELRSDDGGVLTFHHVGLGPEYSGRIRHVFFLIPIGKRTAPIYYCRFYRNGDLVAELQYNELYASPEAVTGSKRDRPKVTRLLSELNVACNSLSVPEHLQVQSRFLEDKQEFHIVERTVRVDKPKR